MINAQEKEFLECSKSRSIYKATLMIETSLIDVFGLIYI